jgi:hypothetical protein
MRLALLLLFAATQAQAEVSNLSDNGFTVRHSIETKVEPYTVYQTITSYINEWWSADHSYTGDAANLYMKVETGGCFCERLPEGGRAEHLRLIYFAPGRELRFDGALGPLQGMAVQGRMIWKIVPRESGSEVVFTYHVFGHPDGGLKAISGPVDTVIGEQLLGLKKRLEWP